MSQGKKTPVSSAVRGMSLPGIISALVVLIVLALLGRMLYERSDTLATESYGTDGAAQMAPTTGVAPTAPAAEQGTAAENATAPAGAAAPTGEASAEQSAPAATGSRQYSAPPPMTIDPSKNYQATITTPRGDIVIRLRPDIAPQTVNNFVFLAREGFYNELTWHRVIRGFMAQGGDPNGDGTGDPGYKVPAEFTNQLLFDRPGLVAMARAQDPNSAGSQFFITTAPAPHLNGQYTIFGEVVQGQDIANSIPLRDPATATTPGESIVKITISGG